MKFWADVAMRAAFTFAVKWIGVRPTLYCTTERVDTSNTNSVLAPCSGSKPSYYRPIE